LPKGIVVLNPIKKSFAYGDHTVTLETAEIARQAGGAVMVTMDDTVVLATVVGARNAKPGQDFFPLTVDYQERAYAAGRIPGGFFKREGRPSEKEILTCRLIDRPLRPLFPDAFYNEVQVVCTVMSCNPEIDPDIPAMLGASAAMAISGIPFSGPIGAARVAYIDGKYVLCPTKTQLESAQLNLVVAGTEGAVLMVESEAMQLSEEIMLGAVVFGHDQMQAAIKAINELVEVAGKPEWDWQPPAKNEPLIARVAELAEAELREAYRITSKQARTIKTREITKKTIAALTEGVENAPDSNLVGNTVFDLEAKIVRSQILNGEPRIDGRDTRTVRPIVIRNGVLPRTHGSALFTRGETQAMVVATLGTGRDEQIIDALAGEYRERFMFHYNMPPYATGETGPVKFSAVGDGGLFLTAGEPKEPLKPKDSLKLDVTGQAAASGLAGARFAGQFQNRTDAVELKLRINSGHVRDTQVWFGSLAGTTEIKVPLPAYLTGKPSEPINPEEVKAVLTVAGSPFLRMSEAIHYLLNYPYGCVEQTSSGVLALAALRGVIQQGLVSGVTLPETDQYLNRGVQRILSLQTDSGGFAYWPGQREPHVWGSIYAAAARGYN